MLREPDVEHEAPSSTGGDAWIEVSRSAQGIRAWERVFGDYGRGDGFLVTVLLDATSGQTRTLYTASTRASDKIPRVSQHVRREADDFAKRVREQAQKCA